MTNSNVKPDTKEIGNATIAKAIIGGSIGSLLEWFDYALYGYFAVILADLFFASEDPITALMSAFVVFGIGFVMRPIGGIFFGRFGDKHGRKGALAITIVIMGIGTFLIGILPTYEQVGVLAPILLATCRLIQGFSTGGETGACTTFIVEYGKPTNKAFMFSWVQFSQTAGMLLGSLSGVLLTATLSKEALMSWGWRVPFMCGLLIAIYGMFIRRNLDETPEFKAAVANNEISKSPLKDLFTSYRRQMIAFFIMLGGSTIAYWMVLGYMPTYITRILEKDMTSAFELNSILLVVFMILVPLVGLFSDKFFKARREPLIAAAAALLLFAIYPLFKMLGGAGTFGGMVIPLILLALLYALINIPLTATMMELFPTSLRSTGFGLCYNVTVAIFGGTSAYVFTGLIAFFDNPLALTYYCWIGMAMIILAIVFLMGHLKRH